jgi:micrococcal nuclease
MYEYKARITSIYDGDTVTAEVDLGFNVRVIEKIRLARINTPEIRGEERPQGLISRDRLRQLMLNQEVMLHTIKDKKGKYGRYLGELFITVLDVTFNVNDWLVSEGLAEYKEY